jgi:hypothetical protein
MIFLNENSTIYIACPANYATGGPELLHQLCDTLRTNGYKAFMFYYEVKKNENPIHPEYQKYNIDFSSHIDDNDENYLIVPETNTEFSFKFKKIKKIIWWLSVDNYFNHSTKLKGKLKHKLKMVFNFPRLKHPTIFHFYQSFYAKKFLLDNSFIENNLFYLSDYLNDSFIAECANIDYKQKENIVLYNPKKGIEFTKKIIHATPELNWVAIENMSRNEVIRTLQKAKVYIDFGNHPGKDRIPREAAISGCCVITNTKGSAGFIEDVAIDSEFKIIENDENVNNIIQKIYDCLNDYEDIINKFEKYRSFITHEHENFISDVLSIFHIEKNIAQKADK